jgi:hypothetical protein
MATGIVSIGAELQACHRVAVVLFVTHVIAFLVPLLLNLLRVFRRPAALLRMHGHALRTNRCNSLEQVVLHRRPPLAPAPGSV